MQTFKTHFNSLKLWSCCRYSGRSNMVVIGSDIQDILFFRFVKEKLQSVDSTIELTPDLVQQT